MMERKKKRDKSLANGGVIDSAVAQPGDIHSLQRDSEEQGCAKRLAAGAANSDGHTQPFLSSFNSSYQQQQSVQQTLETLQHSVLASMPQLHAQTQHQPASQQGIQGDGLQQLPPGQHAASGWQKPECSALNAGAAHFSLHPGFSDSNWQPSNYSGAQGTGSTVAAYNYPGGFVFPPPPFPGLWDPMSWWGHNTLQQLVFPYPFPGYGSGYVYPVSPAPSVGAIQRGFIKTPPGLSQKHRQLWEAQSIENAQLWATVARAEIEISCHRAKILKLEGDLLAIKAHQEMQMDASAVAIAPQPAKRGRQKKVVPASIPTAGLSASEPTPLRPQGRKLATSRLNSSKIDDVSIDIKKIEKHKSTLTNHMPAAMNCSTKDKDQKSSSQTVGMDRIEMGAERNAHKHTVECQGGGNENGRLVEDKNDLDHTHVNQSSLRTTDHLGLGKDENCEQIMEMEEASMVTFLKSASKVAKQSATSGIATNVIIRAQSQAYCGSNGVERSNAVGLGKAIHGWQYAGEDGSDEQDEVVASGQDDEEGDDDETTLDDISVGKVGNYMVLDSTTAMSKEMTALSRW